MLRKKKARYLFSVFVKYEKDLCDSWHRHFIFAIENFEMIGVNKRNI